MAARQCGPAGDTTLRSGPARPSRALARAASTRATPTRSSSRSLAIARLPEPACVTPTAASSASSVRSPSSPTDILTLALAPDRIPWGHLNVVDMGAGGYRTLAADAGPMRCEDIRVGDTVEINGREHYRKGMVIETGRYEHTTDVIFPCMVVADIQVVTGDSGGAVLVNGAPAGIISRELGGKLGFTPLAEGLENLDLVLCATPECDLSPARAVQPTALATGAQSDQ